MVLKKEFKPPDDKTIEVYARKVCQQMAERHGDSSYADVQTVNGLANLLKVVARVETKRRNRL